MPDTNISLIIDLKMRYKDIPVDPDQGDTLDIMVNNREVLFTLTSEHLRELVNGETLPIDAGGFYGFVRPITKFFEKIPPTPPPRPNRPLPTPRSPSDVSGSGFDFLRFFRRNPRPK